MNYSKRVSLLTLSVLAMLLVSFTWAYWNSGTINVDAIHEGNTVVLGSGNDEVITTEVSVSFSDLSDKMLVPVGFAIEPSQVDSLEDSLNVLWSVADRDSLEHKMLNGAKGTYSVEVKDITFKDGTNDEGQILADLVNVSIEENSKSIVYGEVDTTAVTYTLNEPANKEIYDQIAGKEINVNYTITLTPEQ